MAQLTVTAAKISVSRQPQSQQSRCQMALAKGAPFESQRLARSERQTSRTPDDGSNANICIAGRTGKAKPAQTKPGETRSPDGIDHLQAHVDTIGCMLGPGNGQAGHAVITVPEDLDAQALVLLRG